MCSTMEPLGLIACNLGRGPPIAFINVLVNLLIGYWEPVGKLFPNSEVSRDLKKTAIWKRHF